MVQKRPPTIETLGRNYWSLKRKIGDTIKIHIGNIIDFNTLKEINDLKEITKFLRNKIAGYITSVHRKEKIKLEQESNDSSDLLDEKVANE